MGRSERIKFPRLKSKILEQYSSRPQSRYFLLKYTKFDVAQQQNIPTPLKTLQFNPSATEMMDVPDLEKHGGTRSSAPVESSSVDEVLKPKSAVWRKILGWGVEENGIIPVPLEKRTDERVFNLFTVWFTALLCLLPYVMIACSRQLAFTDRSIESRQECSEHSALA